jgi:hypothetical protein
VPFRFPYSSSKTLSLGIFHVPASDTIVMCSTLVNSIPLLKDLSWPFVRYHKYPLLHGVEKYKIFGFWPEYVNVNDCTVSHPVYVVVRDTLFSWL